MLELKYSGKIICAEDGWVVIDGSDTHTEVKGDMLNEIDDILCRLGKDVTDEGEEIEIIIRLKTENKISILNRY